MEFRGVSEFFSAPPGEASSLELDTVLAGVVATVATDLGALSLQGRCSLPEPQKLHRTRSLASHSFDA